MTNNAILALEDGSVYQGFFFGEEAEAYGEVVFCTSMAGYQEMLTDPSFAGQILVPTYPLIGNYGVNGDDIESNKIQVRGFVVREQCQLPSHFLSQKTIHQYLAENKIPGIYGVDTRSITRKLRSSGVMMGIITGSQTPQQALASLRRLPDYGTTDYVKSVSTPKVFKRPADGGKAKYHIAILDCGTKYNIIRLLNRFGCDVTVMPCTSTAAEVLAVNPDGILLSPGPGDPALLDYIVNNVSKLLDKKPIMGICLGNQFIARAYGAKTFKLKFGHRGANHPVRELATGKVYITAQNHGYAVDPVTMSDELEVTHVNLNDGTVEGIKHKKLPIFAIQYHSEASPGPLDNTYLFQRFLTMIEESR
jgi:carbamoyl-phosphate synthase small subunit